MHEIRVSVASPEAADYGVAKLSSAGEPIGFTILEDGPDGAIERRRDDTPVGSARTASLRRSVKPSTYLSSTHGLLAVETVTTPRAPTCNASERPFERQTMKSLVTGTSRPTGDSGLRTHEEFARVLGRAGYSCEFISEVLSQLADPIDLERDQQILLRYDLSREHLMDRLGASP
jgi:hypothetical protein